MGLTKRTGDTGFTTIYTGDTVRKDHDVVEAIGAYEELTSRLGLARLHMDRFKETIIRFQRSLVQIMGAVSSCGKAEYEGLDKEIHFLDVLVEEYTRDIGVELKEYAIPGDDMPSAELHVARASCRLFERRVVKLQDLFPIDPNILKYLNRLSDVIYLMAVIACQSPERYSEGGD